MATALNTWQKVFPNGVVHDSIHIRYLQLYKRPFTFVNQTAIVLVAGTTASDAMSYCSAVLGAKRILDSAIRTTKQVMHATDPIEHMT